MPVSDYGSPDLLDLGETEAHECPAQGGAGNIQVF